MTDEHKPLSLFDVIDTVESAQADETIAHVEPARNGQQAADGGRQENGRSYVAVNPLKDTSVSSPQITKKAYKTTTRQTTAIRPKKPWATDP